MRSLLIILTLTYRVFADYDYYEEHPGIAIDFVTVPSKIHDNTSEEDELSQETAVEKLSQLRMEPSVQEKEESLIAEIKRNVLSFLSSISEEQHHNQALTETEERLVRESMLWQKSSPPIEGLTSFRKCYKMVFFGKVIRKCERTTFDTEHNGNK